MNDIVEDNLKTEKTKTFSLSSRHSLMKINKSY